MRMPFRNLMTVVTFVAAAVRPQDATATSGCSGSTPEAVCVSIADDEIWLYLTLDLMSVIVAAAAQNVAFGPKPQPFPVHPLNVFQFPLSAMTIGAGLAGWNDPTYAGMSRFTFGLGAASAVLALVDTVVIARRYRKARRRVRIGAAGLSGRF